MTTFEKELASLLNKYSRENASNTPDFILAMYLEACLLAFDAAVQQRETWYGRDSRPTVPGTSIRKFENSSRDEDAASQKPLA